MPETGERNPLRNKNMEMRTIPAYEIPQITKYWKVNHEGLQFFST